MSLLTLLGGSSVATGFAKGSFALDTATGDQSVTGLGFEPKLIIFYGNSAIAQDSVGEVNRWMFGAATNATDERVMAFAADDNAATSNAGRGFKTDACIYLLASGTPTDDCIADFTSMDADGFTINISDAPAAASIMHYLAFGGDDITGQKVGSFAANTSTGAQAVTGVGFQPDVVIFFSSGQEAAGSATFYRPCIGAAIDATHEWLVAGEIEDAQATTQTSRDNRNDACITNVVSGATDCLADFTSMDADGFTINWSNAPAAANLIGYIALQGLEVSSGSYAQPVSDTQASVTGVGFQPEMLFIAGAQDTNTGFEGNSFSLRIGSGTATDQGAISFSSTDGAADSVEYQVTDTDKLVVGVNTAGAQATHALTSIDSDGFTYTTVGTSSGTLHYYLAFAAAEEEVVPSVVGGGASGGGTLSYYYRASHAA